MKATSIKTDLSGSQNMFPCMALMFFLFVIIISFLISVVMYVKKKTVKKIAYSVGTHIVIAILVTACWVGLVDYFNSQPRDCEYYISIETDVPGNFTIYAPCFDLKEFYSNADIEEGVGVFSFGSTNEVETNVSNACLKIKSSNDISIRVDYASRESHELSLLTTDTDYWEGEYWVYCWKSNPDQKVTLQILALGPRSNEIWMSYQYHDGFIGLQNGWNRISIDYDMDD